MSRFVMSHCLRSFLSNHVLSIKYELNILQGRTLCLWKQKIDTNKVNHDPYNEENVETKVTIEAQFIGW